jgi:hypothetical protein
MTSDFDYEAHERLRERVANVADSALWTYKAYYRAADFYSKVDKASDWGIFGVSALLTTALIWDQVPHIVLIGLAILTAALAGFRRMISPGDRAKEYYKAADAYQRLFDNLRDFIKLELADEETGLENMKQRYRELAETRKNLNEDMPKLTSRWYEKLDDSIYDEVETTEQAKQQLTGEADLGGTGSRRTGKEQLTGSAKLHDSEEG